MADLWQSARSQIASYEHRTSELQLALATEKEALEAVLREVKQLEDDRSALDGRADAADAQAAEARQALAEKRAAADRAAKDTTVLNKHLELLQGSSRDAAQQLEADRKRYREHLSALRGQLAAFQAHLSATTAVA
ncbi:hypothetical protein ABPG77_000138 [Micractinium sp. CCAP 211/92]